MKDKGARRAYKEELEKCRDTHIKEVTAWEQKYRESQSGRVGRTHAIGSAGDNEARATKTSKLATRKLYGILWTPKTYKRIVGRAPRKAELVSLEHCGEMVTGVLRSPSHGRPAGSLVIESTSETSAEMSRTIALGSDEDGHDAVTSTWEKYMKKGGAAPLKIKSKKDADGGFTTQIQFDQKLAAASAAAAADPDSASSSTPSFGDWLAIGKPQAKQRATKRQVCIFLLEYPNLTIPIITALMS